MYVRMKIAITTKHCIWICGILFFIQLTLLWNCNYFWFIFKQFAVDFEFFSSSRFEPKMQNGKFSMEFVKMMNSQWLLLNFWEWLCRNYYYYVRVTLILIAHCWKMRTHGCIVRLNIFGQLIVCWIANKLRKMIYSFQIYPRPRILHPKRRKNKTHWQFLIECHIQWICTLTTIRNQFNWCRWQCDRHLTDAWNCFIVSGSWFGIQKITRQTKHSHKEHRHTHAHTPACMPGFGVRQMTGKVTVTIKTFQWFHWDRLLLWLLLLLLLMLLFLAFNIEFNHHLPCKFPPLCLCDNLTSFASWANF